MITEMMRRLAAVAALGMLGVTASMGVARADETSFTWDTIHRGDCRMYGATWTIHSDGTATFDGNLLSSTGGDAWLMHAELFDHDDAYLANLTVDGPPADPGDIGKFVMNLQFAHRDTHWITYGKYDRNLYPLIGSMKLRSDC
ncbi:DUF6294 family protein [Nocardia sp. NPDC003482]|uniref:DUF6294 family protein n=1 Tax=Nocardia sp. NPDC004068 TaxID=3364303 RepID=UPI0036B43BE5